ncbi:MAG: tol-pal system YbgF family protein [Fluviicola sp.]
MLEDISGQEIKDQFKKNKRLRIIAFSVGGVLLLVLGYFVWYQMFFIPTNEKSKDSYWEPLNYAKKDSTEVAIEGFRSAVRKYDGKVGGEVAQFLYARQLMNQGEFNKAYKELEEVELEDSYVTVLCAGLRADCKSEMGKYSEASKMYVEAANMMDNDFTTPMYLHKAAGCAEELNDFKTARKYYKRIIDDYPQYATSREIERFYSRVKNIK